MPKWASDVRCCGVHCFAMPCYVTVFVRLALPMPRHAVLGCAVPCCAVLWASHSAGELLSLFFCLQVFYNRSSLPLLSGQSLASLLQQHLTANIMRVGGMYLLQSRGIPQGSLASTLLC